MPRLSRAESQALTREQLVSTARRLFVADGFLTTSLEKIAADAGYSKGAVYSNFSSKFELGFEVLDLIHQEQAERLRRELADTQGLAELMAGFDRWAQDNIGNAEWTMLELEFVVASRGLPAIRGEVAARRGRIQELFAAIFLEHQRRLGLELPMSAEAATALAVTMAVGVGVQRTVDPKLSASPLVDLLRTIVGADVATDAESAPGE